MDFGTAAITATAFVVGAAVNAIIATGSSEYRARRDEERRVAADQRDRLRNDVLAHLEKTKRSMYARMIHSMAVAMGDLRTAQRSGYGAEDLLDEWPRYDLLGDEELLRDFFQLLDDLEHRSPGSKVSSEDFARWGDVEGRLLRAAMDQRRRILSDEPIKTVPWDQVGELDGGYERALERRAVAKGDRDSQES